MKQRFLNEEQTGKGFKVLLKAVEVSLIEISFLMSMSV